jgi:hypothetical protein
LARTRNLKPTEGARFVLERQVDPTPVRTSDPSIDLEPVADVVATESPDGIGTTEGEAPTIPPERSRAIYRVSIYTPAGEFSTTATLVEDGHVQLAGATGAPGDLDERLKNIAKLVARDAPKRRDDGLVVWPARIMRWRK